MSLQGGGGTFIRYDGNIVLAAAGGGSASPIADGEGSTNELLQHIYGMNGTGNYGCGGGGFHGGNYGTSGSSYHGSIENMPFENFILQESPVNYTNGRIVITKISSPTITNDYVYLEDDTDLTLFNFAENGKYNTTISTPKKLYIASKIKDITVTAVSKNRTIILPIFFNDEDYITDISAVYSNCLFLIYVNNKWYNDTSIVELSDIKNKGVPIEQLRTIVTNLRCCPIKIAVYLLDDGYIENVTIQTQIIGIQQVIPTNLYTDEVLDMVYNISFRQDYDKVKILYSDLPFIESEPYSY